MSLLNMEYMFANATARGQSEGLLIVLIPSLQSSGYPSEIKLCVFAGYTSNTQHLEPKPALQVAQHESKESFQYGLDHILDLQWNDLEELQLPLNAVLPM